MQKNLHGPLLGACKHSVPQVTLGKPSKLESPTAIHPSSSTWIGAPPVLVVPDHTRLPLLEPGNLSSGHSFAK